MDKSVIAKGERRRGSRGKRERVESESEKSGVRCVRRSKGDGDGVKGRN